MSAPLNFSESGSSSGRKPARPSEKSSFSHTCSLLSKYLKQRGSFGDLSIGITSNPAGKGKSETFCPTTTMNLLPRIERSDDGSERKENDRQIQSMDLFPQQSGFGPSEVSRNSVDTRPKAEPETAQLTIFYGGKVHVFDDFPADKVTEVMLLASSSVPQQQQPQPPGNERRNFRPDSCNFASMAASNPTQPNILDLPIARKVSLHRFLEKRKERISSRAPYKLQREKSVEAHAPKTTESSKTWLGLTSGDPI